MLSFQAEKYEMLSEELRSPQCKWIVKGPPNKRYNIGYS